MKPCLFLLLFLCAISSTVSADEPTWVELDNVVYGAKPDERGPIGGGDGYTNVIAKGDYTAETLDALLDALSQAKAGQTVLIPGETEIDLTARIYIDQLVLEVPEGVTLAGNRGKDGSLGALLTSDALKTPVVIRAAGPDVRITGLRLRGPNPKRYLDHHRRSFGPGGEGHKHYYKLPTSNGIKTEHPRLEVDNCEISGFSHAGIYLTTNPGHHIHHNYIHHCQYQGLGYGVSHNTASSLIEYNRFNWNRHSIAGTGRPGNSYIARHNVELGMSLSHCFDMHGGRDRKDGTDIAGTAIEIYHNTFRAEQTPVVIRGVPEEQCDVHHNWFVRHQAPGEAVRSSAKTDVHSNAYGRQPAAANEPPSEDASLTARLSEMVPQWMAQHHVPAVSIALIRDRDIAWSHQFGVKKAGVEGQVNEESVFEACSMSKPVFAYAVMKLKEEGTLDLDTPLDSYLPEPYLPHEPEAGRITARMVLNHTTGLPNWREGGRRTGVLKLKHKPGERFTYSGEGMWYLQRVVEHLTEMPIDAYMKHTLMDKIGMSRSSYVWLDAYTENNAHGHDKEGIPKTYRHYSEGNVAFSLYTTPVDYARYLILMMDPDPKADFQLRAATVDRMLTIESQRSEDVHYGLGWGIGGSPERRYVFHGGSNGSGFRCHARFYRDDGSGIVIMTNGDSGASVYGKILEQVYP